MNKSLRKLFMLAALMPAISYAVPVPHYISVTSSQGLPQWSIQADLYAGNGKKVYHWQENGHRAGSSMRWNYKDGGDRGWLDIFIQPSGMQHYEFKHLPLNGNHCYSILPTMAGSPIPVVLEVKCPN